MVVETRVVERKGERFRDDERAKGLIAGSLGGCYGKEGGEGSFFLFGSNMPASAAVSPCVRANVWTDQLANVYFEMGGKTLINCSKWESSH